MYSSSKYVSCSWQWLTSQGAHPWFPWRPHHRVGKKRWARAWHWNRARRRSQKQIWKRYPWSTLSKWHYLDRQLRRHWRLRGREGCQTCQSKHQKRLQSLWVAYRWWRGGSVNRRLGWRLRWRLGWRLRRRLCGREGCQTCQSKKAAKSMGSLPLMARRFRQ